MATKRKPGDPWNQFSKKGKTAGVATRKPKPKVTRSKALPPGKEQLNTVRAPQAKGKPIPSTISQTKRTPPKGGPVVRSGPVVDVKANTPRLSPAATKAAATKAAATRAAATRAATTRAANSARNSALARGTVATSLVGALLSAPEEIRKGARLAKDPRGAVSDVVNNLGFTPEFLGQFDRKGGGTPSGPGSRRGAAPVSGGGRGATRTTSTATKKSDFTNARADALARIAKIKEDTDKDIERQRTANEAQARRSQAQQQSPSRSSQSSSARRSTTSTSSSSTPSTSTSTAGTGREWKDFNPGRGTSESNNPLLNRQGGYLRKKMQEREDRQSQNVGPVKDGAEYEQSTRALAITARRKAKEEDDKNKKKPRTGFSQKDSFE